MKLYHAEINTFFDKISQWGALQYMSSKVWSESPKVCLIAFIIETEPIEQYGWHDIALMKEWPVLPVGQNVVPF